MISNYRIAICKLLFSMQTNNIHEFDDGSTKSPVASGGVSGDWPGFG